MIPILRKCRCLLANIGVSSYLRLALCCLFPLFELEPSTVWGQASQPILGMQKRYGDEIMVCGQLYRIGAPVKLWIDEGGFDAYRTERRFAPFAQRKWKSTVEEMQAGKVEFVAKPQETSPDRYGMRFESSMEHQFSQEQMEQIRGGGWNLDLLKDKVDQFVLHFDVCGTSAQCFYVLHDRRGLSVHFMLDVDGTIYQTLDVKERAWQATALDAMIQSSVRFAARNINSTTTHLSSMSHLSSYPPRYAISFPE